jgi:hypothetical protein
VVPNELARVTEELRANVTVFLTDLSDKNVAKTIHEELLSQVAEFSGKSCMGALSITECVRKRCVVLVTRQMFI